MGAEIRTGDWGQGTYMRVFLPEKWALHSYTLRYTLAPKPGDGQSSRGQSHCKLTSSTDTTVCLVCAWVATYGRATRFAGRTVTIRSGAVRSGAVRVCRHRELAELAELAELSVGRSVGRVR